MLQDLDGMLSNPHIALKVLREYGGTDPILSCAVVRSGKSTDFLYRGSNRECQIPQEANQLRYHLGKAVTLIDQGATLNEKAGVDDSSAVS